MTRPFLPGLFIACGVLALGLVVAFTVGRYPVTLAELVDVLVARLGGRPSTAPPAVENVVLLVRGPRVAAAVLVGAALAVAGTAFQGLFRNPLVSPDILGASSGAALGAVLGIYFSLGIIGIESLAFAGGLVAVAAVYLIGSLLRARDPILVLVLTAVRHRTSGAAPLHDDFGRRAPAGAAGARAGAGAAIRRARRADRQPRFRQPGQGHARNPRACRRRPRHPVHHP
jgi:ABC-type Fe3+-siderophore transport system permease subunit